MSTAAARALNQSCFCVSIDQAELATSLERVAGEADFLANLTETRPHLIASRPVFLAKAEAAAMTEIVAAIEAATRLPGFHHAALAHAPEIARLAHGPAGAFMGYDFHLTDDGPKLIEINTNAGGAFLNAFIARAQRACCGVVDAALTPTAGDFDASVVAMFESEWRRQRGSGRPRRIAVVDDAPGEQYLYPEFMLAQRLLELHGIVAVIADAQSLRFEAGVLTADGEQIDLVYNRLVDFALAEPRHAALSEAYRTGAVVVTPNPANHAMHADKRNLALLAAPEQLTRWGLDEHHVERLRGLLKAEEVSERNADALWAERKRYFFKPVAGHGGKAVYRGDKLTRSTWASIQAGGYIAQELAAPSERAVEIDGVRHARKLDVRLYTYEGRALLAAARVYQGQTTNFRTPGGGFAPVLLV